MCWVLDDTVQLIASHGINKSRHLRCIPEDFSYFVPERIMTTSEPETLRKIGDFLGVKGFRRFVAVPLWSYSGDSMGAMLLFDPGSKSLTVKDLEALSGIADLAMDGIHAALKSSRVVGDHPLENALMQAKESMIAFDTDAKIFAWNEGAAQMYGRSAKEMLGASFYSLIPPEQHTDFTQVLEELGNKPVAPREVTRLHQSGFRLQVRSSLSAIFSADGSVQGYLELSGLSADPERMAAVEHFRSLVEHLPMVFVQTDAKGLVQFIEGQVVEKAGFVRHELIGRSVLKLYRNHPSVLEALEVALRGESLHRVVQWRGRYFDFWATPLRQKSRFLGCNMLAVDITDWYQERENFKWQATKGSERIRQLLSNLPVLLIAFDAAGKITLLEGQGVIHFGGEELAQAWIGEPIQRLVEQDLIVSNLVESALAGDAFEAEFEFLGFQLEVFVEPIFEDGVFVGSNAVVLNRRPSSFDLETMQHMKAEYARLHDLNESIFASIDQGVIVTNEQSEFVYVSPVFAQFLGYTPAELLGKSMFEYVAEKEQPRLLMTSQKDKVGRYRLWALHKDGSQVLLEVSAFARHSAGATLGGSVALVRTVTPNGEYGLESDTLTQLEQEREQAFAIANSVLVGLVLLTPRGVCLYANPAFCALSGYALKDLQKLSPFDLVYQDDHNLL
ncbi:MAG: PAS domain S-box protein, partial [Deinococcales bacterium]